MITRARFVLVGCGVFAGLVALGCGSEVEPGSDNSIAGDEDAGFLPDEPSDQPDASPASEDPATCDLESGLQALTVFHEGEERVFDVVVPQDFEAGAPLAIDFHGFTSNKDQQRFLTDSDTIGTERGYVVAYPQGTGTPRSWNAGVCCAEKDPRDDVGFAKLIVDELASRGCVDRSRVYAMGLSNGGFLAHRLACEAADVFAAVAPVAGVLGMELDTCAPFRPIPVLHTHGRLDTVVPYAGSPVQGIIGVEETISQWLAIDGCDPQAYEQRSEQGYTCTRYNQCDADASVELCVYDFAGHVWPGGRQTTTHIFDFFDSVRM